MGDNRICCRDGQRTAQRVVLVVVVLVAGAAAALAQLVTGYRSADTLCEVHGTPLVPESTALLAALFPRRWRLSRNESWTYAS